MFPQARLVSLQLDEESMKREPLPPAKEAPLTFGSSYVQELLGGDNDVNDKKQPTRKPQFRLRLHDPVFCYKGSGYDCKGTTILSY